MAENLNTLEINETLKQLLSEVKGQKQELNSLKEEVRGTSVSVSSEVKKLKKEKKSLNGVLKDIKFNSYLTRNWKMGLNKLFGLIIIRREIIWWNFWMSCLTKSRKGTNLSVLRILPKGAGKLWDNMKATPWLAIPKMSRVLGERKLKQ